MWGVGPGVISMSNFYATSDDTVLLPAYARVDGAVFFSLNKYLRGQLNVENMFGERYYPTADTNNNITSASPHSSGVSIAGRLYGSPEEMTSRPSVPKYHTFDL